MGKFNFINQRFGRLLVLRKTDVRRSGAICWECQCDCGKIVLVTTNRLKQGTQSCRCLSKEISSKNNSKPFGVAEFNKLLSGYQNSAHDRNIVWALVENDFKSLISDKCFYCGIEPSNTVKTRKRKSNLTYNGIDRVDNNKGYEITNVVTSCKICNYAKRKMSKEEFLSWTDRVYNFQHEKIKKETI